MTGESVPLPAPTVDTGGRAWLVAAITTLGFTTSLLNALCDTPGSTSQYQQLVFAFAGGTAVTYGALSRNAHLPQWPALKIASVATFSFCVGTLCGLPAGIALREWSMHTRLLTPSNPLPGADVTPPTVDERRGLVLHGEERCGTALAVLAQARRELDATAAGRSVVTQYELLLEEAGCD